MITSAIISRVKRLSGDNMHSSHQEYSREVFHYSFKYEKTTDYLNHFQKLTKAQS